MTGKPIGRVFSIYEPPKSPSISSIVGCICLLGGLSILSILILASAVKSVFEMPSFDDPISIIREGYQVVSTVETPFAIARSEMEQKILVDALQRPTESENIRWKAKGYKVQFI
jgi:hypothetical protein